MSFFSGVAKAITKAAKPVGKLLYAADQAGVPDIASGSMDIAAGAQSSASQTKMAYDITGDIVSVPASVYTSRFVNAAFKAASKGGAQAAQTIASTAASQAASKAGTTLTTGAATGPGLIVAIAVVITQIFGMIIDIAWNPFKNYFNSDLETIRIQLKKSLLKTFRLQRLNWPLEVKPNIMALISADHPSYEYNLKQFQSYYKQYLDDRGFITNAEVLAEENMFLDLLKLKRSHKSFRTNENGELVLVDPTLTALELQDTNNNNMLLLLAMSAYARRLKRVKKNTSTTRKLLLFSKSNWQLFFWVSTLLVVFLSCSVISIS